MNERIRELREQAGLQPYYDAQEGQIEKFAELIVRECANICFSEAEGHSMAFGDHCGIVIKSHFGVEE